MFERIGGRWRAGLLVGGVVVVVCSLGLASGAAATRAPAKTRLTIQTWPEGVFGYVSSPAGARCARGRRVEVFAEGVNGQSGKRARRIASRTASRNQTGYIWMTRAPHARSLYAVARPTRGCAAARSKTVSRGLTDVPHCPAAPECIIVLQIRAHYDDQCPSFNPPTGNCIYDSLQADEGWRAEGDMRAHGYSRFSWDGQFPRAVHFETYITPAFLARRIRRALSKGQCMMLETLRSKCPTLVPALTTRATPTTTTSRRTRSACRQVRTVAPCT
jgi:hypothetical protein